MEKEFCIMPEDEFWKTKRFKGSHRHEVFGGVNRQRSIKDGLVIFLNPEMHNMSDKGIHFNTAFRDYAHYVGQKAWMKYYNKTKEDFIKEYGRNYL
jgi:hypothetical protein